MPIFVNSNGKKYITDIFVNVNGQKRSIVSAWVDKNGVPTKIFGKTTSLNMFILYDYNDKAWGSHDGITWVEIVELGGKLSGYYPYYMANIGDRIIIFSPNKKQVYTYDGKQMKDKIVYGNITVEDILSVAYYEGTIYAIGTNSSASSNNKGDMWASFSIKAKVSVSSSDGITFLNYTYGSSYDTVKIDLITTSDGESLSIYPPSTSSGIYRAVYGKGKLIVFGNKNLSPYICHLANCYTYNNSSRQWSSTTISNISGKNIRIIDVIYAKNRFIAIGSKYISSALKPAVYYSEDGITWLEATLPSFSSSVTVVNGILFGNDKFLIYANNVICYSEDGITWVKSTSPSSGGIKCGIYF